MSTFETGILRSVLLISFSISSNNMSMYFFGFLPNVTRNFCYTRDTVPHA